MFPIPWYCLCSLSGLHAFQITFETRLLKPHRAPKLNLMIQTWYDDILKYYKVKKLKKHFYWKHNGIQNLPECCGLKFLRYCFICQSFRLFQPGSLLTTSTIQVGKLEDCTSSICDFQLNFRLIYSRYINEYKLRMKMSSSTTGLAARSSATKTVAEE